jgi:hypothetical protein
MDKILENISKSAVHLQTAKVTDEILNLIIESNKIIITNNSILETQFHHYFSTDAAVYFKNYILKNYYDELKVNNYTNVIAKMVSYYKNVYVNKITVVDMLQTATDEEKKQFNDFTLATLNHCKTQDIKNDPTCYSFIESTKPGGIYYNYSIQDEHGNSVKTQDAFGKIANNTCWNPAFCFPNYGKCPMQFSVYIFLILLILFIILKVVISKNKKESKNK